MKGLFSTEELNADNVKDKDSKLAFLQKLVDYLSIAHGYVIPVRIMSVIAGKEPEKTNELLYLLADMVNKGVDNEECVTRTQRGDARQLHKKGRTKQQENNTYDHNQGKIEAAPVEVDHGDRRPDITEKPDKKLSNDKSKQTEHFQKTSVRARPKENGKLTPQLVEQKKESDAVRPVDKQSADKSQINGDSKERTKIESGRLGSHGQGHTSQQGSRSNSTAEKLREGAGTPSTAGVESPTHIRVSRPPSVKGSHVRKDEPSPSVPRQEDGKSETPPNARLAPPRIRRPTDLTIDDSARITGPSALGVSTLIIPEAHQDSEDDDDAQFVIEETVFAGSALRQKLGDGDGDEKQQDHGGLVKKMLQSKKDFEAGNILSQSKIDPQGYMSGQLDEATRQRERAQMGKDIDRLCQSLQSLSRSALPLGKLMDFVQEDLESMQQEFERWTAENRTLKARLREEENLTQSSIQPLRAQLAELQNYAAEQRKAIATFKAKILSNDERIHDMLSRSIEKTC
ncbi:hypothetical protein CRM22_009301 [Opisthorchis felineus]|nr:hypothetical protein CRM22_009301 [Opisthorchis felineus]